MHLLTLHLIRIPFFCFRLARRQSGAGKSRSSSSAAAPKRESKAFELVRKAIQDDVTTQLVDVMQSFRKKLDAAARKLKKEGKVCTEMGSVANF